VVEVREIPTQALGKTLSGVFPILEKFSRLIYNNADDLAQYLATRKGSSDGSPFHCSEGGGRGIRTPRGPDDDLVLQPIATPTTAEQLNPNVPFCQKPERFLN